MGIMLAILGIAAAMVLLCIRVILRRGGRFSSQHISDNRLMRERGIHCATSQDREARRKNTTRIRVQDL